MPLYTYQCTNEDCGLKVEKFVSVNCRNSNTYKCSECGNKSKRVMDLSSFQLKGDGWAKDGYSSKKPLLSRK